MYSTADKQDTEPVSLSTLLTQLLLPTLQLHLFPKSTIDVFILVLESDSLSNLLSAGMTVSSAAVADAGIPMSGLGVGSVVVSKEKELLVDPSVEEEGSGEASVCLGIMPALGKVTDVWFTGEADVEDACLVSLFLWRSAGVWLTDR
jgi:exosome complex component MTR3